MASTILLNFVCLFSNLNFPLYVFIVNTIMITITQSAQDKIQNLLSEENRGDLHLRTFVQGGGCSGFQYGFTFDEQIDDDDQVIGLGTFKLLIDSMSWVYLSDVEIDYREDLNGASFVIKNPTATSTCGCGNSFSI